MSTDAFRAAAAHVLPFGKFDMAVRRLTPRECERLQGATVTLKLTISRDKTTQKRQVRARVSASIPEGVDDSHTRKGEPSLLLSVGDDHPGQQRIA